MQPPLVAQIVLDLLIVLAAGLVSGVVCKRLGISVLVGYLLVGALLGAGGLGLVAEANRSLEYLARAGALFLLFGIGIEFSLDELVRLRRHFFVGGSVQMVLVAVPVFLAGVFLGLSWQAAVLVGSAAALSSTVLVYRALEEWGHATSPHGRRAVGILLFQDVALVPLMLLVPLLTDAQRQPVATDYLFLAVSSALFVAAVLASRMAIRRWAVPLLARLRSTELVILFALTVLTSAGLGAYAVGLPPALGAFAAGVALSGNRLTSQMDALVLPYRETFAAVFFVGLGTLMRFDVLAASPLSAVAGLAGLLVLKALAATLALRLTGLHWRAAWGMGLGLAQLGELSFLLLVEGHGEGVIDAVTYNAMLFIATGTLVATPQLLKIGLRWAEEEPAGGRQTPDALGDLSMPTKRALVVGLGPIGCQVASQLETKGMVVCLIDFSSVNLYPFAQQGFRTVTGDARDSAVLLRADVRNCSLTVVTVPEDETARQVVTAIRGLNPSSTILVRCRYQWNTAAVAKVGADAVISEEAETAGALLRLLDRLEHPP
jgi:CPA2 family monovalent cation:H+ antiporter-2